MLAEAFKVAALGVADGAISLFLTKSALLNTFHAWLEKKAPFLEKLLSCPWCTSHWIALFLVLAYRPLLVGSYLQIGGLYLGAPLDYLVSVMAVVSVAMVTAGIMYKAVRSMTES